MPEIDSKTVLVTGANRGIGRAIATTLAAEGANALAGVRILDAAHGVESVPGCHAVLDLTTRRTSPRGEQSAP